MDKVELYRILDISSPDEFVYYENLSALIEEDKYIESNLIKDLFKDIDMDITLESLNNYFEEILRHIPDKETDLAITFEQIKMVLTGLIKEDMTIDEIDILTNEFSKFRKWYVLDQLVFDKSTSADISVRDAIYNTMASKYTDEICDYDYRLALNYDFEGYDIKLADIIDKEEIQLD